MVPVAEHQVVEGQGVAGIGGLAITDLGAIIAVDAEQSAQGGRRRRVYQLTAKGHRALAKRHGEWMAFVRAMDAVVGGLL